MKKVFLVFLSVMAIALTGCKIENANVEVSVKDTIGLPVAKRAIFYIDKASYIISAALPPSPEELITGIDESGWDYAETNSLGTVTLNIPLIASKVDFYFEVFDDGSKKWIEKKVELRKGQNDPIEFVVNK